MSKIILVSGASRSGKSSFAEEQALMQKKPVAYLATAQGLDDEMQDRIRIHRERRPASWKTFEEPIEVAKIIMGNHAAYPVWILDCVTLYISNLLLFTLDKVEEKNLAANDVQDNILQKVEELIKVINITDITLFLVTNEVGWGLVPPDPVSRLYRDITGRVNQRLAKAADEVYMVMLGIPQRIKPGLK